MTEDQRNRDEAGSAPGAAVGRSVEPSMEPEPADADRPPERAIHRPGVPMSPEEYQRLKEEATRASEGDARGEGEQEDPSEEE
jgi:hypothetical protein